MYYQNSDDYMRDMFYFNQMPNQNMGFQNYGYSPMNFQNQMPNYNNLYPSIYRIVQPVISRTVSSNNTQYLTEESLNSMVDNVYNIVEGDVNSCSENDSQMNSNQNSRTQQNQSSTQSTSSNPRNNDNNQNATVLLKDLIKILIIKEVMLRNHVRRVGNQGMYQNQFYPNYYEQRYMY